MILLLSDNHFGQHGGRIITNSLQQSGFSIHCVEDQFVQPLGREVWQTTSLLALHMIAGTSGNPLPSDELCDEVFTYLQSGSPVLLLHGGSAAFWHKDWWRPNVGLRWVRNGDPDQSNPSWHPVQPYKLECSKTSHPLAKQLLPIDFPTDEIYVGLEQTSPIWTLMHTRTDEGTFPQAYLSVNEWGGQVAGYLPGHKPEVVSIPENLTNIRSLIEFLSAPQKDSPIIL